MVIGGQRRLGCLQAYVWVEQFPGGSRGDDVSQPCDVGPKVVPLSCLFRKLSRPVLVFLRIVRCRHIWEYITGAVGSTLHLQSFILWLEGGTSIIHSHRTAWLAYVLKHLVWLWLINGSASLAERFRFNMFQWYTFMYWKEFEKIRSRPHLRYYPTFYGSTEENHESYGRERERERETSSIYWAQMSRFFLKTETRI
jgi:hypothetical protein